MYQSNHRPRVLFLVGMSGAGKSTCVEHLKSLGIPSVYFGGIIIDEVKKRNNGIVSQDIEKLVREELRQKEGMGAIANRIIPQIDTLLLNLDSVVADGLYSWQEYKIINEHYGTDALIIAVTAPRHIRHDRLRNRPFRPLQPEEANKRDHAEIEGIEKGGPIANADFTINNENDPLEMLNNLDRILHRTGFLDIKRSPQT